jgi:hypothetical protein
MGSDREVFGDDPNGVPLYEGRMVDQFDHRAKGYHSGRGRSAVWPELEFGKPGKSIQPQWRVPLDDVPARVLKRMNRYRIGFCDVTSPTNERTLIAALLPPGAVSGHKVPTVVFTDGWDWAFMVWLAIANSFTMDFLARKKVSLSMSYTVLDSLPFPRLQKDNPLTRTIVLKVLQLTCCGLEMIAYWNARAKEGWVDPVPAEGPPPGIEDEAERLKLRAEIDTIVARDVFGLTATEMDHVLTAFPGWREREEKRYGEFRIRRLIFEAWNLLAQKDTAAIPKMVPQPPRIPFSTGDVTHYLNFLVYAWSHQANAAVDLRRVVRAFSLLQDPQRIVAALQARDSRVAEWLRSFREPIQGRTLSPILRALAERRAIKIKGAGDGTVRLALTPNSSAISIPNSIELDAEFSLRAAEIELAAAAKFSQIEQSELRQLAALASAF